jgi:HlyD family secretion protein
VPVRRRDRAILRQLQVLYDVGTIKDLTDGQLLERFATDGDEAAELAFAALVERHAAIVWRVCLAILREEHDAEDAFQATFLVLVRKARSLWVRNSLGPWLHQVACRTASCLRATIIRRRTHERCSAERNATCVVEGGPARDADRDAAVHEEVNRLPEKYRAPLVLCDLEGRTHQEAARFLGWPIGTVKSRQSQGRGLVRDRLARRGLGLAVSGTAAESLRQAAVAAMPRELSQNTAIAAMRATARLLPALGASGQVLTVTLGVLRAMLWTRIRSLAVAALAMGIASGGAMVYVRGSQEPEAKDSPPVSKQPTGVTAQRPQPKTPDKAPLKEQPIPTTAASLRAQQFAARKAKLAYEIASLNRQIAEFRVEEYEELTYPRDLAQVQEEIDLSEADLSRAEEERKRAIRKNRFGDEGPHVSPELAFKKAQFALEQAQSKKKVLVDYTRHKTIKELKSEVEKAASDELAKKAIWTLEVSKEKKLERELKGTGRK